MKYDLTIVYAPGIQIPVCLFFRLYIPNWSGIPMAVQIYWESKLLVFSWISFGTKNLLAYSQFSNCTKGFRF